MLEKLRGIYEERQHLNQITMSIMLPRPQQNCGPNGKLAGGQFQGPTALKMQCVERWGGGCMLSQSAELVAALDQLKANLTLERKLILQLHEFLLRQARPRHLLCIVQRLPFCCCVCALRGCQSSGARLLHGCAAVFPLVLA